MPIFGIDKPPPADTPRFNDWLYRAFSLALPYRNTVTETTAARTLAATDTYVICNYAGTVTLTLPDPATAIGRPITVKTWTANTVVSASSNVVGPTGGAAGTAILSATAGKWADLISNGTTWYVMRNN